MFNSQRKSYKIYRPEQTRDSYNQEKISYNEVGSALVFLSLNGRANYSGNDTSVLQCEYVGVTNHEFQPGDLLDMKYEIKFIQSGRRENFIFCKEYNSNGRN